MPIINAPTPIEAIADGGTVRPIWYQFFSKLADSISTPQSGTTANRPTTGVKLGSQYWSTTVGRPMYVSAVTPVTWVYADGSAA